MLKNMVCPPPESIVPELRDYFNWTMLPHKAENESTIICLLLPNKHLEVDESNLLITDDKEQVSITSSEAEIIPPLARKIGRAKEVDVEGGRKYSGGQQSLQPSVLSSSPTASSNIAETEINQYNAKSQIGTYIEGISTQTLVMTGIVALLILALIGLIYAQ